jgi:CheY-like chemotaxis protein
MEEVKTIQILVVDDEKDVVDVLKSSLSRKGYAVTGALNGEEALAQLKEQAADLILLDMVMPGLTGTEVARIVKKKYPHTKIVVVTAFPTACEGLAKENISEASFIKPFKLQELYAKLEEISHPPEINDKLLPEEIKAKTLCIRASILFVGQVQEAFQFLRQQFQQLALRGQHYNIDLAGDETTLFRKVSMSKPDIVVFDETYLHNLDVRIQTKILLLSHHTKEVVSCNLAAMLSNPAELEKLFEKIRILCIQNGLLEIR